jgi:FkbM family methyltransferase
MVRRGPNVNPRRVLESWYRAVRAAVWASPLARHPAVADAAVRLGTWVRRHLQLVPSRETIGIVRGHRMWFGPASECYLDMTQGIWEPGVTHLFETFLKPGMVVVDVGAHIGYFSLVAARQVGPGGKVYAFEPAPENYALLVKNIHLNGYRNIVPVPQAASDREGDAEFFLHRDSVAHSLHAQTSGKHSWAIDVHVTTLDRFFEVEGWPPVQLAKLDIEGAEPTALDGMRKLISRNQDIRLVVEYIPHILQRTGTDPRGFLDTLRAMRFSIWMVTDDNGLVELNDRLISDPALRTELWCVRDST